MRVKQLFALALPTLLASTVLLAANPDVQKRDTRHTVAPKAQDSSPDLASYYLKYDGAAITYSPNQTMIFPAPTAPVAAAKRNIKYDTATGIFTFNQKGDYQINYGVGPSQLSINGAAFALFVKGNLVDGSQLSVSSTSQSSSSIILTLKKGDTVELRKISAMPVALSYGSNMDVGLLGYMMICGL